MPKFVTQLYYGRLVITSGADDFNQTKHVGNIIKEALKAHDIPARVQAQWVLHIDGHETIEQSERI